MQIINTVGATEAAKLLGVSRGRVHQLIQAKILPAIKWGPYWLVDKADIKERLAKRTGE